MKAKTTANTFRDVYPDKKDCIRAVNDAKKAYQFLYEDDYFRSTNLHKKRAA